MNIEELEMKIIEGDFEAIRPAYRKYKEGHIFDENESVKWNQEKVKEENQKNKERLEKYYEEKEELSAEMKNKVVEVFFDYYNLTESQLEVIYEKALSEVDSNYELFDKIHELANFFIEVKDVE